MATTQKTRTRGAVIYTRVSTGEQDKHGTSPETQRDACRAKALELALPIIAEKYDPGVSGGFFLSRPGIQEALALISAGQADTLIFATSSRMTRNREHLEIIKRAVKSAGGRLVFCDMDYSDTPTNNLHLNVKNDFEVYERELFRERSMNGRKKRAEQGVQPGRGRSPYGYIVPTTKSVLSGQHQAQDIGRYLIDESRAEIAREIFTRYASGEATLSTLCHDLATRGIPTPRAGAAWWPTTICMILKNPVYKGQAAYGRTNTRTDEARLDQRHPVTGRPLISPRWREAAAESEIIHIEAPALVSEAVWEEAQRRLNKNRTYRGGNPQRARMLSGRAFLPCGHTAVYQPATLDRSNCRHAYYSCSVSHKSKRTTGEHACDPTSYRADVAESAVAIAFLSAAHDPQAIEDARRVYAGREQTRQPLPPDDIRAALSTTDRALTRLREEEAAAIQAQIAGIRAGASPDAYAAVFADVAAQRKDLEDQRGHLTRSLAEQTRVLAEQKSSKKPQGRPNMAEKALEEKALEDAALVLSAPDVPGETKRDIVGMVVERVVCKKDGAEIHFLPGFGVSTTSGETGKDTIHTVKTVFVKEAANEGSGTGAE